MCRGEGLGGQNGGISTCAKPLADTSGPLVEMNVRGRDGELIDSPGFYGGISGELDRLMITFTSSEEFSV